MCALAKGIHLILELPISLIIVVELLINSKYLFTFCKYGLGTQNICETPVKYNCTTISILKIRERIKISIKCRKGIFESQIFVRLDCNGCTSVCDIKEWYN